MRYTRWWNLCLMVMLMALLTVGFTASATAASQGADFLVSSVAQPHNAVALARLAVIGDDSFMRGASIALVVATLGIIIALRRK